MSEKKRKFEQTTLEVNPFEIVPNEITKIIFSFVPEDFWYNVLQVCKKWKDLGLEAFRLDNDNDHYLLWKVITKKLTGQTWNEITGSGVRHVSGELAVHGFKAVGRFGVVLITEGRDTSLTTQGFLRIKRLAKKRTLCPYCHIAGHRRKYCPDRLATEARRNNQTVTTVQHSGHFDLPHIIAVVMSVFVTKILFDKFL